MKRLALCAALAALVVSAIAAGGAGAKPSVEQTCVTRSKNVSTKNVTGTVVGSHVSVAEKALTECPVVVSVMNKMLGGRAVKPKLWESFLCQPTVVRKGPAVVDYRCVYRAVSTQAIVKLTFTARYKSG